MLPNKPLISLRNATLRLGTNRLLSNTTWHICQGQHWLIQGPNGAGKSTLVRALFEAVPLSHGHIHHHHGLAPAAAVGYVAFELHQDLLDREKALAPARYFSGRVDQCQTVREVVLETTAARPPEQAEIDPLARRFDIQHVLDRPLVALSLGELRKVLILRALLKSPQVLILDEPYTGLDRKARRQLAHTLNRLSHLRISILLVTHHWQEIPAFITHQIVVHKGNIVYQGAYAPEHESLNFRPAAGPPESDPKPLKATHPPLARRDAPHTLIRMRGVNVRYGDQHVLKNLSWCFHRNEHWALLGPNGCGKTTIARLVAGDHPQAYANRIWLFGKRRGQGESIWDIRRQVGRVSIDLQIQMNRAWKTWDVILSGFFDTIGLYRQASGEQKTAARQWLARMGITHLAERDYDSLSAGERRLVMLARAMVKSPLLLILDEPCQGLDGENRCRVLETVDAIGRAGETHLLLISHHQEELVPCISHVLKLPSQETITVRQDNLPETRSRHRPR